MSHLLADIQSGCVSYRLYSNDIHKEGIFGAHHKNMLNNLGLLSSKRSNSLDMVTLQNFGIGFGLTILTSEIRTKDLRVISLKE